MKKTYIIYNPENKISYINMKIKKQLDNISITTLKTDSIHNIKELLINCSTSQEIIPFYINRKQTLEYIKKCMQTVSYDINNKHNYLYIFITNIKSPKQNTFIVKIGYSTNMLERKIQLKNTLHCDVYLLLCTIINGEYEEKQLHKFLQTTYPQFYYPIKTKLNKILSTETYLFVPQIMNQIIIYISELNTTLKIEEEKTKQLELEYKINMEKTKQLELEYKINMETTKQLEETTKQLELEYKTNIEKLKLELEYKYKIKQLELEYNTRI